METLIQLSKEHLHFLCNTIDSRRVGGEGNRVATAYLKEIFDDNQWKTNQTLLNVMDWKTDGAILQCSADSFDVLSSPYSVGCNITGTLVAADSLDTLMQSDITGKILLLHGEIASEQIMPKNFVFYNPPHHAQLIAFLEQTKPSVIVCATGMNSATAGGVYPFPLFEDGDFDIPSVYMKDIDGEVLLRHLGETVTLESRAQKIAETAYNLTALKGSAPKGRIVISAHIDAKIGTPGAIDNATGVTVLLLLSELLKDYSGPHTIEMIAFNGEDYYAVPGQMEYIRHTTFDDILLNINIDGAGYKDGKSCFSAFDLPSTIQSVLDDVISSNPNIEKGLPWVQGDHSIFIQAGCPAIAVSSSWFIEHMETQDITHTPKDNLSIVSYQRVVECALAIEQLIRNTNHTNP